MSKNKSTELTALLATQQERRTAEQKRDDLEQTLSDIDRRIAESSAARPSIADLERQLEDIGAALAVGHMSQQDFVAREAAIGDKIARIRAAAEAADAELDRLKQTRNGVQRLFDVAKQEAEALRAQHEQQRADFLSDESDRVYDDYVNAAAKVKQAYCQLVGLERLLGDNSNRKSRVEGNNWRDIFLPACYYRQAQQGVVRGNQVGVLFSATLGGAPDEIADSKKVELDRLRELGLEL